MVPIGRVYHLTKTKLQHIKGHISLLWLKLWPKRIFTRGPRELDNKSKRSTPQGKTERPKHPPEIYRNPVLFFSFDLTSPSWVIRFQCFSHFPPARCCACIWSVFIILSQSKDRQHFRIAKRKGRGR